MIRQERRKRTRDYQKELDRLVKASNEVYRKSGYQKLTEEQEKALKDGTCEDKRLVAYFNLMNNISERIILLQNEITRINTK